MIENIRLSFKGIWSHKMRSFLTMLGIIIGISAIIAIVSTIQGTNEQIKQNLIGAGNNVVNIQLYNGNYPLDMAYEQVPEGVPVITEEMRKQLLELDQVEGVSLYRQRQEYDAVYHLNTSLSGGMVLGIDISYLKLYGYQIQRGRGFDQTDYQTFRKVCLLDQKAAKTLFASEDPIGRTIEIKQEPFVVIGIVAQSDEFVPNIESIEDYYTYAYSGTSGKVMIPDTDWPTIYRYDEPQSVAVKASSTDAMTKTGKEATALLNQLAGLPLSSSGGSMMSPSMITNEVVDETGAGAMVGALEGGSESSQSEGIRYKNEDLLEQAKKLQEMSNATNQMLIWIASISLLVGGIGVMNIMLVSVTERTREIGLKKAIGARKPKILGQFLTEAAVLTSLGGILGVIFGVILAKVISMLNGTMIVISVPAVIVSVLFSMLIGIVFGLLPSVKAANLNPIDALRYE